VIVSISFARPIYRRALSIRVEFIFAEGKKRNSQLIYLLSIQTLNSLSYGMRMRSPNIDR